MFLKLKMAFHLLFNTCTNTKRICHSTYDFLPYLASVMKWDEPDQSLPPRVTPQYFLPKTFLFFIFHSFVHCCQLLKLLLKGVNSEVHYFCSFGPTELIN